MGESALEYLIGFIDGLDDAPAEATEGAIELARELRAAPPERGGDFAPLFDEARRAIEKTFEYAGPGYLAYIPGGGLYTAALADFLAQGVNRYVGLWQPSPAVVQIEENVTRWLCDVFDYPATSQGLLLSGGSMANLSAMVTARHAKLGEDFLDGTYYVSEQAHASVTKAATIAGFSKRNLRIVPTDAELRMDPEALAGARARGPRGRTPAVPRGAERGHDEHAARSIRSTRSPTSQPTRDSGCTSTAPTAGSSSSPSAGVRAFRGIERSDSVTLDPHKGMFLPYGTGGLVVRDGQALRDAHLEGAAYLQDLPPTGELPNYSEYSAELSRDWRGLRVWFPLRLHGVAAFREALDEKLDLAHVVVEALEADPNVEVCWRPQLSTVAFRLGGDADDDRQAEFLRRINASRRVFLSSTRIHGRYVLRICIVSHRTHRDRIDECIEIVAKAAAELAV